MGEGFPVKTFVPRIKQFLCTRDGALFMALLVGAVAIRIPLMQFPGYYADLSNYVAWGEVVNQHFTAIYTTLPTPVTNGGGFPGGGGGFPGGNGGFPGMFNGYINYPPGTPYLFGAIVFLYHHFLQPGLHTSLAVLVNSDGIGPLLAKIPLLLADVAAIIYLYWQARKRHSARFALLVTASYAFSPALLYNGAIWGQTDGLAAAPLLIALLALLDERYIVSGVSLALALLLKPQPVISVPLILLYLWRWRDRRNLLKFSLAGLLTLLLFLAPILIPRVQVLDMFKNIQAESYNDSSLLTSNAFNFWWLFGYAHQSISSAFLGIKSETAGEILFGSVTLVSCIQIWRHREPVYLCLGLAVQAFGFFLFMGSQHERYLFLFIPLALASLIAARRDQARPLIALYALGTALCFLNMAVGVSSFDNSQVIPFLSLEPLNDFLATNFDALANVIAYLHLATFVYLLWVYLSRQFEPAGQRRPDLAEAPTVATAPEIA
jgi:hypothetical protein